MSSAVKWIVGIIVVIVLIWIGVSMSGSSDSGDFSVTEKGSDDETGPIKIGLSAPLSGEAASFGEFILAGAEHAVQEINAAGGVNGRSFELVVEDDQCNDTGATVFNKLVNVDQVDAIIGPVCSAAAGPGIPIAQEAGVPTIIWATAPPLTATGDYIFRSYPSDSVQGVAAAEFIYNDLGKTKASVLYVNNDWGLGISDVFVQTFESLGGKVLLNEGVAQETTDVRTQVTKVKDSAPEVVYMPMYPQAGVPALKQMKELGIDVPIVGGDAFSTEEVFSVPESDGIIFFQGKTLNPDEFVARVEESTGKATNYFTPVAYDSINILAQVMGEVGTDKDAVKNALDELMYVDAVSNTQISFDEQGDLEGAQVDVRLITEGEVVSYQG